MEKTFSAHIVSLLPQPLTSLSSVSVHTADADAWESESGDEATFAALSQRFALKHDHIWSQKLATQLCGVSCAPCRTHAQALPRCERAGKSSSCAQHCDAAMTTSTSTPAAALEIAVNWHSLVRSLLCSFLFRQSIGAVAFHPSTPIRTKCGFKYLNNFRRLLNNTKR